MPHARRPHPFRSFDRHLHSTCETGWHPIRGRRVRSCKASTADLESFAETGTELACVGSHHRRFMRSSDASSTRYPFCNRVETVDSSSFHVLVKGKYRLLFSPKQRRKRGPKGPSKELIDAIVEMKRRDPNWGCPRIAQQITLAFGIGINKDVVRRVLDNHYHPELKSGGPSWLTFIGHM
jgi:hypothetical protein